MSSHTTKTNITTTEQYLELFWEAQHLNFHNASNGEAYDIPYDQPRKVMEMDALMFANTIEALHTKLQDLVAPFKKKATKRMKKSAALKARRKSIKAAAKKALEDLGESSGSEEYDSEDSE